jgi:hypothetical protein
MPNLSAIGDPESVKYLYSKRTIFLVEGPGDKNAFEAIVGSGYEADVEFQIASAGAGQGGCKAVRDRVAELRPGNKRVFGLLDGEVAASVGATQALLYCSETIFTVPSTDGLIFLGAHELENIYFENADVPAIISSHRSAASLHRHPPAQVAQSLDNNVSRFIRASVYKYTSAYFHSRGEMRGILSTKIFGQAPSAEVRKIVVAAVTSGGKINWETFVSQLIQTGRTARDALRGVASSPAARRSWLLRIADGKELLAKLRQLHGNLGEEVEGALLREVCKGGYPNVFRTSLFRAARVTPSTFAS